jgi:hypothetical protein
MNIVTATLRDLREFLESKRIKREKVRLTCKPVATAIYKPPSAREFKAFRALLRSNSDFGTASERIDSLERDLFARDVSLPVPVEFVQNSDRSLTLQYDGLCVRAFPEGVGVLIGGITGHFERGVTPALIGALTIISKRQHGSGNNSR